MKFFKNLLIFTFFTLLGFGLIYTYLSSNPQIKMVTLKEIFNGSKFSLIDPPNLSLKADIVNLRGEIFWQSRVSETPVKLETLSYLQQGEGIETGDDGSLEVSFRDVLKIIINKNTKLDILQTLPANIVFSQGKGNVKYQKISNIPVSVRSGLLLIEVLDQTEVNVSNDLVEVSGNAKIAYNNNINETKLREVPPGRKLVFNNQTLKVAVE